MLTLLNVPKSFMMKMEELLTFMLLMIRKLRVVVALMLENLMELFTLLNVQPQFRRHSTCLNH